MAIVGKQGDWYMVMVNNQMLATFTYLLDAHCFALQLMERGLADSVQLYSGRTVT